MNRALTNLSLCLVLLMTGTRLSVGETAPEEAPLPLDEIRTLTEVFAKIKSDYVEQIDDKTLLENAVYGMLEKLDPHSSYLDAKAYSNLQEGATGEFGGLGIEVGMEDGFIKVIAPIDDTPAARAGIQAGDLIIKLDDRSVKGMTLSDAVVIMRGKPGSPITLTVIREKDEQPLVFTIIRDIIKVKSVKFETLEPGFGYLRISSFQTHTVDNLRVAINQLQEDNDNQLKGVVLDLRNNPGGILDAAIGVSDLFLNQGLIVYTEGRTKNSKFKFNARPNAKLPDLSLIVLVNAGSASASEIVAGAIQDHARGIIMGEQTFGKGSVQTILPMNGGAALKLTTARYYTPNGRSIQASGITPDIVIDKVKISLIEDAFDQQIKEANLTGHLTDDRQEKTADETSSEFQQAIIDAEKAPLSSRDYALYEALNVLKGLAITATR